MDTIGLPKVFFSMENPLRGISTPGNPRGILPLNFICNPIIINKRYYSTSQERPWFATGLIDAEGCFNVVVTKSKSSRIGWRVQLRFIIEMKANDRELLDMVNSYFSGTATVVGPDTKGIVRFSLVGFDNIMKYVLPHFEKYPLQSAKRIDYDFWVKCAHLMKAKEHLTLPGVYKILAYKGVMNLGLSPELRKSFPDIVKL